LHALYFATLVSGDFTKITGHEYSKSHAFLSELLISASKNTKVKGAKII